MHDLGIFGTTTGGQSVFVGVEAKVDETFGASVRDTYLTMKAKQITGTTTNAPKKIGNYWQCIFMTLIRLCSISAISYFMQQLAP